MNNYLNIPENFGQEEKLSALLDSMLNMLTLNIIFLSELQNEGENSYYFITAFVDANIEPIPSEVIKLIAKIEKEYPGFKIRIYTEATSETALERGSLYFVEHCCLGFTLFTHSEGDVIMDYQNLALNTLLKRAVRYCNAEMQKVNAFVKAADELIAEKQFGIATFNLHQAFELTFRFIERMCLGKSKITHSIISHIKYCEPFFPILKPFLKISTIENNELLLLMEHAYSVARYGDEYHISEIQVQQIRAEFDDFIKEVEALFNKHLSHCKQRIDSPGYNEDETTNESSKNDSTTPLVKQDQIKMRINKLIHKKLDKLKPETTERFYNTDSLGAALTDVLSDIDSIMKVCITTLEYNDSSFNQLIDQPNTNVRTVLEHVLQLLPFEELECLIEIIKEYETLNEKEE